MSHHLLAVPFLAAHPVGWVVLGAAGYLAYSTGKKAGQKDSDNLEQTCLGDRVVKSAMKTAYKAKMKADDVLSSTRNKYADMWREARNEVAPRPEPTE